MKFTRKVLSALLAASLISSGLAAGIVTGGATSAGDSVSAEAQTASTVSSGDQGAQDSIGGSAVLHCFDWSYNSIKENLDDIKAAGYTAVQTSPVQPAKDYNASWTDQSGQWWKLYQPLDISVADSGETWLGSKDELEALCTAAEEKGIKVICDIVANHMANISGTGNSMDDINTGVSSTLRSNSDYWHINSIWADDSSRYNMTQGSIGEPDLNTGNSYIQQRYKSLLIELIEMGVDGFRFDAAKHIELPTDSGCSSDFWPTVIEGSQSSTDEDIFYYGEILNSPGTDISNYTTYMCITDNYTSDLALVCANNTNASGLASSTYNKGASAEDSVLWVESHDTYMGSSGSAGLSNTADVSDSTIIKAWAIVGSRANSTSLFFARPAESMGDASTDTTWKSTAVAEVNKFKNYFDGETEYLSSSGNVAYNERGTSGVVISKLDGSGSVSLTAHKMADGTYTDQVSGNTFTVSGGVISGTVGSTGVAVVYNPTAAGPSASVTPGTSSYKTETLTLTLSYSNATSGQYSIDGGSYVTYTDGDTITIGSDLDYGTATTVTVKATDGTTTSDAVTYTYTKKDPSSVQKVYFDNSSYGWSSVYAYIYAESGSSVVKNAAWPGVAMTLDSDTGYYTTEVSDELSSGYVIFTESYSATTNRYPADGESGLSLDGKNMLFASGNSWTEYTGSTGTTAAATTVPATTSASGNLLMGDANTDDSITIDDATEIQRYAALIITFDDDQITVSDVNDDGDVDILDVTAIQYYLVGNTSMGGKTGQYTGGQDATTEPATTAAATTVPATTAAATTVPATTAAATTSPSSDTYTIVLTNNYSWSSVYCYYWSDSDTTMTSWPGVKMTYSSTNDYSQDIYTIEVPADAEYIIFNNGGNGQQTVDIAISGSANYYISGGSGTSCTVKTWT